MAFLGGANVEAAHLKDAQECFSENVEAHFGRSEFPVYEGDGHFSDGESEAFGVVFHLDLKGITNEVDGVQTYGF